MKRKNTIFSKLYVVLCLAFFYLPILVTMIFSFNSSKSLTRFTGFSLRWYGELINNMEISKAVYVSVTVAILATVISTVLGTITAIGLSKSRKVLKEMVLTINNFPILNPEIVTAIGLMLLFSSLGMTKGYLTMLLAHIAFCTPYVITSVYPKVRSLDPNLANAAMDLGATPYQALTKVIVPMIKEGIFAGALLAFTMSFDDFVISYFVSGNGVKNISIVVYNMTKRINPTINALSTIVIVVIVLVLLFANLIMPKLQASTVKKMDPKKRRIVAVITAAAVVLVLGKWTLVSQGNHVLRVYNAGEYMDLSLLDKFEKQYNCTVVYETFESNEMMYTKLASGETYDVLVPSDYMIERLIKEEYLQALDWKKIPNSKNLLPEVQNKDYDPGNRYSCPYFWGTVGILYNKNVVSQEDLDKEGWNILCDEKYKGDLYMYDSERDSFMIALKALGYSMNTKNLDEIYNRGEFYNSMVAAYIKQMLITVYRAFTQTKTATYFDVINPDSSSRAFSIAANYIAEHIYEKIKIGQMCEELGYTPSYISNTFKKATGLTVQKYINNLKMQKAIEMMQYGKISETKAALKLGYSDLQTFNKAFRRTMGCSPVTFINEQAQEPQSDGK